MPAGLSRQNVNNQPKRIILGLLVTTLALSGSKALPWSAFSSLRHLLGADAALSGIEIEQGHNATDASIASTSHASRHNYLIYTTVGGAPKFLGILRFLLDSLNRCAGKPVQFDVLIITDPQSLPNVTQHIPHYRFSVDYMVVDPSEDKAGAPPHVAASMRKLNIFSYSKVDEYEGLLFLDADIITTFDPSALFSLPLKPDVMYAPTEQATFHKPLEERFLMHGSYFYGLQNYTEEQMTTFKTNNIYIMNAGILLFRNTPEMKQHFINLRQLVKDYTGGYFYEQCFINYYFNSRLLGNTTLIQPYVIEARWATPSHIVACDATTNSISRFPTAFQINQASNNKLTHFLGCGSDKVVPMTKAYHKLFSQGALVPNRTHDTHTGTLHMLLKALSVYALQSVSEEKRRSWWSSMGHVGQVPKQVRAYRHLASQPDVRTICEIGFNAGHSTAVLMSANPGAVLYSFDTMELPYSQKMYELFKHIYPSRFYAVQGSSFETVPWLHSLVPTLTCDLFSVDGDLSHDGLLTDMLNAIAMMPVNATILVDDVTDRFPGRKQAWNEVVAAGYLSDPVCQFPDTALHVTVGEKGWCYAKIANTTGSLMPVHKPAVKDWYKVE